MLKVNQFPELTTLANDDSLLIWDTSTNVTKKVQLSTLKAFLGSSPGFNYSSDGDTNGIFYYIGTNEGAASWTNPHTAGKITISMSSAYSAQHNNPQFLVNRQADALIATQSVANSWYKVDLNNYRLIPKYYSIRARNESTSNPSTWKLQGSNDNSNWIDLDSQTGRNLNQNQWSSNPINNVSTTYRYFRVLQTGTDTSGGNIFCVSEFELYGSLSKV